MLLRFTTAPDRIAQRYSVFALISCLPAVVCEGWVDSRARKLKDDKNCLDTLACT
jgi:hypothetical protein